MNLLHNIFSSVFTEALGWTIVHSLWQASAIAIVLSLVWLLLRRKSAQIKYFISFIALIGILFWSAVTFVQSYRYAVEKQLIKTQMINNPKFVKSLLQPSTADETNQVVDASVINMKLIKTRAFFQRNFNWICFVWFCGMLLLMFRLIGGYVYTRRLRTYQLVPLNSEWLCHVEAIAQQLGIRRKVNAFFSPLANVPMTLGTIKPIILFPVSVFTGLSANEIEAIIAHELAHVMRNDYLFNIIQSVVEILFFYHPAVWIISAKIRAERESSCDNIAIEVTGDKLAYVKALTAVQVRQSRLEPQLSMAFSLHKNNVLQRIKRIQKHVTMKTNFIEGLIAAAVIIVGLTLASFTIGHNDMQVSLKGEPKVAAQPLPKAKTDSIRTRFEQVVTTANALQPEELRKVAEVAYSEIDTLQYAEMMQEIDKAMREIDVEKIVQEAMKTAQEAMKNASLEVEKAYVEIDREQIKRDMESARIDIEAARKEMEEDMRSDMSKDGVDKETMEAAIRAASAGMDVAAEVVGNLDIEGITKAALDGTSKALEALGKMNLDSMINSQHLQTEAQMKAVMEQLEVQKKQIEIQQKQLKKEMKELEKESK